MLAMTAEAIAFARHLSKRAAEMCRLGAELESLYSAATTMYAKPEPPFALGDTPSSVDFAGEQRAVHEIARVARNRMCRRGCGRRGWLSYRGTLLAAASYLENRW